MNVMKQDAMDDKIKERCKTCKKQCMQEDLDKSSSYRAKANLERLNSYRANGKFLDGSRTVKKLSRQSPKSSMDQDCVNFYLDKKKEGLNR